jgi:hypothetical protein
VVCTYQVASWLRLRNYWDPLLDSVVMEGRRDVSRLCMRDCCRRDPPYGVKSRYYENTLDPLSR